MGPSSEESRVHPWDGFLVGPENALAHAGVMAMARGDDPALSPLVVHGPSGSGKSRLLAALVAERLVRRPESSVAHLGAEVFVALCHEATELPGGWAELRGRFRDLDLLVLDDLHALKRAPLVLEELGHTLDALTATGGAVAVSARVGPGQWSGWPSRLVNRLIGGLSVRVDRPGPASRRRYLLDHGRGLRLSAGAVDVLADAADGYRTLDGWLARIALAGRVGPDPLGITEIESILAEDGTTPSLSLDRIVKDVAARFGIRPSAIRSPARHASLVGPRHLAMHLARELTPLSFAAIGAYFGGRDAATVRHACRAAAARLDADPALGAAVSALRQRWRRGGDDEPA